MAVTPDEAIGTLETAMAQGVREVTYSDGRKVAYASQGEMERAISYWRSQKATAAGRPAVGVSVGAFYRD